MPIATQRIQGFRTWLRKTPQPARLRCGDTVIRIGVAPSKWADAEASVAALDPAIVEAIGNDGDVLRVISLREETESEKTEGEPQKEAWPQSEQAQLAVIITASNDRAASRHEAAYRMSFDALKSMYEQQTMRLEEAIRRNAQLEATILKMRQPMVYAEANDEDDGSKQMVAQVLQAALTSPMLQSFLTGNANSNGKASGDPQ